MIPPIPDLMQRLPLDERGLPVPYVVFIDAQGRPRFQLNDSLKIETALHQQRCGICGQPMMAQQQWLVGGPASAFHPRGAYLGTPTHYECLHYALQMCPHLTGGRVKHLDAQRVKQTSPFGSDIQVKDPTLDTRAVPFFVAVQISGYNLVRPNADQRYVVPSRPFLAVEYWRDGSQRLWTSSP